MQSTWPASILSHTSYSLSQSIYDLVAISYLRQHIFKLPHVGNGCWHGHKTTGWGYLLCEDRGVTHVLHHKVVLLCPASLCLVICLVHHNGSQRFQVARTQVCYTNDAHLPALSLVALESATPTMLTSQHLHLPPFSRIICTILISWDVSQTSHANVTASLKKLE